MTQAERRQKQTAKQNEEVLRIMQRRTELNRIFTLTPIARAVRHECRKMQNG